MEAESSELGDGATPCSLAARDRAQLIVIAYQTGLTRP
jgi:hypothetical protein